MAKIINWKVFLAIAVFASLFTFLGTFSAKPADSKPSVTYKKYKSPLIWCSTRRGPSPLVFKVFIIGKASRSAVVVKKVKYRISPRDVKRNNNFFNVHQAAGSTEWGINWLYLGGISGMQRRSRWQTTKFYGSLVLPRGQALSFTGVFDHKDDHDCSTMFAL